MTRSLRPPGRRTAGTPIGPSGNDLPPGLNGSGKSTMVKLLCRLYDPQRGSIRWDGVDIRDLDPGTLRQRITGVFQDYMSYDLTAAENISLGDLSALHDREAVRRAAGLAGIDEEISRLPHGYDTMLSRMFFSSSAQGAASVGVSLSGGQRQRIALARALLRADRDLLIVDEPMSSLDAAAEHAVNSTLTQVQKGRTCVLISHRLAAVRAASQIIVIADGDGEPGAKAMIRPLTAALTALTLALALLRWRYAVVTVCGASMEPELTDGDRLLCRRCGLRRLRRGQLVVFREPDLGESRRPAWLTGAAREQVGHQVRRRDTRRPRARRRPGGRGRNGHCAVRSGGGTRQRASQQRLPAMGIHSGP